MAQCGLYSPSPVLYILSSEDFFPLLLPLSTIARRKQSLEKSKMGKMKQRPVASCGTYKAGSVPYTKPEAPAGGRSFFGRIFGSSPSVALRDFPFATKGGSTYFSRGADLLAPFGFKHGQRLRYGAPNALKGNMTTVIGVRANRLYVKDEAETVALPLAGSNNNEVMLRYGFEVVGETVAVEAADTPEEWTPEIITFLQTAPDVVLRVGNSGTEVHMPPTVGSGSLLGWAGEHPIVVNSAGLVDVPAQVLSSIMINPDELTQEEEEGATAEEEEEEEDGPEDQPAPVAEEEEEEEDAESEQYDE